MAEYKCGDCFHAELCEKSEMLVGFSRDNPAYCGMFLNSSDVVKVRHGRWIFGEIGPIGCNVNCSECGWSVKDVDPVLWLDYDFHKYCGCCGAKMDGGAD